MTAQRLRGPWIQRLRTVDRINLLAIVVGVLSAFFILTGTVFILFLLPLLAGLGLDGVLRSHPAGRLRAKATSASQLITPLAFSVAVALFFRYAASGYWAVLAAVASGAAYGAVAHAEYGLLDADVMNGGVGRTVLLSAAYAGLFCLLATFYAFDLPLVVGTGLTMLCGVLFAIEVFREAELATSDLALYAGATGFALGQVRWAIGFVRLDGMLAALLLLLVFYVLTGLTLTARGHRLNRRTFTEYATVGLVGTVIVLVARLVTGS